MLRCTLTAIPCSCVVQGCIINRNYIKPPQPFEGTALKESSLAWLSKTIIWAVSFLCSLIVLCSQVPSESRLNTGNDKRNLPSKE